MALAPRRLVSAAVALFVVCPAAPNAQTRSPIYPVPNRPAPKPDFSGRWLLIGPGPVPQQVVVQTATTLTVGPVPGEPGMTKVYRLDDTESTNGSDVSKAWWVGRTLRIVTFTEGNGVRSWYVSLWSLNEKGQLVVEVENQGAPARTTIYAKQ